MSPVQEEPVEFTVIATSSTLVSVLEPSLGLKAVLRKQGAFVKGLALRVKIETNETLFRLQRANLVIVTIAESAAPIVISEPVEPPTADEPPAAVEPPQEPEQPELPVVDEPPAAEPPVVEAPVVEAPPADAAPVEAPAATDSVVEAPSADVAPVTETDVAAVVGDETESQDAADEAADAASAAAGEEPSAELSRAERRKLRR